MWDILGKKNGKDGGKILNEREIQEKLYGKYRVPSKEKNITNPKNPISFAQLESSASVQVEDVKNVAAPAVDTRSQVLESPKKIISGTVSASNTTTYTKFSSKTFDSKPKKSVSLKLLSNPILIKVGVVVILGVILILGIQKAWTHLRGKHSTRLDNSFLIPAASTEQKSLAETKMTTISTSAHPQTALSSASAVGKSSQMENVASSTIQPSKDVVYTGDDPGLVDAESFSAADKPFAVQVCTYRLESDAKKLVVRLQDENLSAFYQGSGAKPGKAPRFFIVYTERAASYQEAQTGLLKFKQSPSAKDFPDAFIRKL